LKVFDAQRIHTVYKTSVHSSRLDIFCEPEGSVPEGTLDINLASAHTDCLINC
ncbi:hypothetical protein M2387_004806, partial [Klebsiella sp. BIGb0407]|nr:hypothetical protein [Klebsiella sp. BIGb0407]